jgi:prepilin-type N-terminal cleavage/methylation domain-containing protein
MTAAVLRYRRSRTGMTMIEMIIVLIVLGVMYYLIAPNATEAINTADVSMMKGRAAALNLAQANFIEANGVTASVAAWTSAANDDARYLLISSYLQFPPATLETYELNGFTITFAADPRQPSVLYEGATQITYQ